MVPLELIQYSSLHYCAIAFKHSLQTLHIVYPYRSTDTTAAWKKNKLRFVLNDMFYFHTIDSLSIAFHAFASHVLLSFSVDETLLPR